jgi:hypothetical protein
VVADRVAVAVPVARPVPAARRTDLYPVADVFRGSYWPPHSRIVRHAADGLAPFGIFSGKQVRIPLDLAQLQAGGWVSETGTINVPIAAAFTEAHVNLARFVQPTSITIDLEEDSMDNSAAQGLATLIRKTREAMAENVNDAMNTSGALLATADTTQASAGGLVLKVLATTDFDKIYPGKVVDVLTATTGADPGQGKRRKIASFDDSLAVPTVTFDTASQASDGGSGNITLSNLVAVYTAGSWGQAMAGIEDAANLSGTDTFQAVARATYPAFKAVDGRNGTTTTAPLSDQMLDAGTLRAQRNGAFRWDFGVGDPAAINVYKNGKQSQVRYTPDTQTLPSGFKGISYEGTGQSIALVPERKHATGGIKLVRRDAATLYGRRKGPDFEDSTGSMFQRFSRALPKELWLVDRLQWGVVGGRRGDAGVAGHVPSRPGRRLRLRVAGRPGPAAAAVAPARREGAAPPRRLARAAG